jgi:manganese transport protein
MNPAEALVLSQVVLSFGIPFALVPLVLLTCRRDGQARSAASPT